MDRHNIRIVLFLCALLTTDLFGQMMTESPTHVGNGGDLVLCKPEDGLPFVGLNSLDYITTYNVENGNEDVPKLNWNVSKQRIHQIIYNKIPHLAKSFQIFQEQLFNDNIVKKHIWEPKSFGLLNLSDELLIEHLPRQCIQSDDSIYPTVIQAVIRENVGGKIIYSYDSRYFNLNQELSPPNFSFLAVHEWLWTFADNARTIRRVNRLLHSTKFALLPDEQVQINLEMLGLLLSNKKDESFRSIAIEEKGDSFNIVGYSPFWQKKNIWKMWIENRTSKQIQLNEPFGVVLDPGKVKIIEVKPQSHIVFSDAADSAKTVGLKITWLNEETRDEKKSYRLLE